MSAGDRIINVRLPKNISRATQVGAWFSDILKRLFDIVVSSIVLLFFAPFYLIIAIRD